MQLLSQSLAENLSALDARFGKSADYYAKKIVLYGCPGCIVMFDGMASLDSLWEQFQNKRCADIANGYVPNSKQFDGDNFLFRGKTYPMFDLWGMSCEHLLDNDDLLNMI